MAVVNALNQLESSSFRVPTVGMNNFSSIPCFFLALEGVSNHHVVIV